MAPAKRQASWRPGRGATKKIGGVDVPGDADLECDRYPPSKVYPDYKTTPPRPLSDDEIIQVARLLTLLRNVRDGPFYAVLGDNVRVRKPGASLPASFDPFESMPTYSQKYMKKPRRIPKLDSRPYVPRFFPKELWSTLDPKSATEAGDGGTIKKLRLLRGKKADALGKLDRENVSGGEEAEVGEQHEDDEALPENQEEDEEEEEVDDDFEDGGSGSDGDDYNAEKYFDDGGDDAGNDYDGGEADGGDYF